MSCWCEERPEVDEVVAVPLVEAVPALKDEPLAVEQVGNDGGVAEEVVDAVRPEYGKREQVGVGYHGVFVCGHVHCPIRWVGRS